LIDSATRITPLEVRELHNPILLKEARSVASEDNSEQGNASLGKSDVIYGA